MGVCWQDLYINSNILLQISEIHKQSQTFFLSIPCKAAAQYFLTTTIFSCRLGQTTSDFCCSKMDILIVRK